MAVKTKAETRELPIESVEPNPDQPRKLFEQDALNELAESIRQHGLLQAIVVRPRNGKFQIIAGERRWRACKLAGVKMVLCRVLEELSDEQTFILSTLENVNRQDMTIIEEAEAYQRIRNLGRSDEEIAKMFGKRTEDIRWRTDLLRLRPDVQHLVARGQMKANLAWYMSKLSQDGQLLMLGKLTRGEFKDETEATNYCIAMKAKEDQPSMFAAETMDQMKVKRERKTEMERWWSSMAAAATPLGKFAELTPVEIAEALGAETSQWVMQLEEYEKAARRATIAMRKAQALYAVAATA